MFENMNLDVLLPYKVESLPKVAIILLNYNGWVDTIECLESVLRNDYPNYQVIVVDNNSQNNSIKYMQEWADGKFDVCLRQDNPLRNLSFPPVTKQIPYFYYTRREAEKGGKPELEDTLKDIDFQNITTKYPLIFIQTGENLGFAGGNNVGIKYTLAKNDFDAIILLNNDTVINKDSIRKLMDAYKNNQNSGLFGGRIYYYSKPEIIWYDGGKFNKWLGRAVHINMNKSNIHSKSAIKEVRFITFCYVLIPKRILVDIGLLDEIYFMYMEDLDYSYRILKKGYKLYHVCNSEIYHKVGASSELEENSSFSAYWVMRNRVRFIKVYLNIITAIIAIAFIILLRLLRFIPYIWTGKWEIFKAQIKGIICSITSSHNNDS